MTVRSLCKLIKPTMGHNNEADERRVVLRRKTYQEMGVTKISKHCSFMQRSITHLRIRGMNIELGFFTITRETESKRLPGKQLRR